MNWTTRSPFDVSGRDIVKNDERLFQPVRCRVLKPFMLHRQPTKVGDTVRVEYHLARDLEAIKKVEMLV